jgi:hypothetical protein
LKVGDIVFTESLDPVMDEDRKFPFEISFDRADIIKPEPALKTLQDFTNLVDGLIAAFAPLLP